jgi:membrane-bound lytic murein transglycosylase D
MSTASYTADGDIEKFRVGDQDTQSSTGAQAEELQTIPIEINENVEMWIRYFQGRGRPHMERYLARSTRYEALMKKVLRDNNLPEDLFYIALIESGFTSNAKSSASAVGYWQFIRGTGKRYKLDINKMIDERRDPVLATQAAAEYFTDLYKIFNSWYLSMAAYNVGEGRVLKVVKKYKTRDFWELSRNKRALPRETDDYVPKYIAAKLIAKNPDKYGFEGIDYMTPIEFDHMTLDQPMNLKLLAEKMDINYEDFKDLNPKYKGEIAPLDEGKLNLRIPPGTLQAALEAAKVSIASIVDFVPDQNEFLTHRVRRGDTLSGIARKYRTNIAYIREINELPRKRKLRIGQRILVPDRAPKSRTKESQRRSKVQKKSKALSAQNSESKRAVKRAFHIIRRGDSLSSIADKYKISVKDLQKENRLVRRTKVLSGQRLALPENATIIE